MKGEGHWTAVGLAPEAVTGTSLPDRRSGQRWSVQSPRAKL